MTAKTTASSIESFKAQDNHTITQVTAEATAEEEEREEEVSQYNEDVEEHHVNDTLQVQLASKSEGKDEHDSKTDKADEASVTLSEKEEVAATAPAPTPTPIPAPTPPASVFATPSASVYGTPSGSRVASPDKLAACLVSISQRKEMLAKQQSSRNVGINTLPPPKNTTTRNLLSEKLRSKFGGGNPCAACHKNVYKVEELLALNQTWHKSCFRCGEIG